MELEKEMKGLEDLIEKIKTKRRALRTAMNRNHDHLVTNSPLKLSLRYSCNTPQRALSLAILTRVIALTVISSRSSPLLKCHRAHVEIDLVTLSQRSANQHLGTSDPSLISLRQFLWKSNHWE